ncbi:unnamed protein product [Cyprideis torosa]|uniref:Uncharacterized protein n=1 Tax=Cyprideis torosa TaxID=163714 RepID=A0A7R8W747_9CRUS|nr:unnamed protein product [Cyprideis torosa]CAG0881809.1 unnamed protein product [Cyprideis torosa]
MLRHSRLVGTLRCLSTYRVLPERGKVMCGVMTRKINVSAVESSGKSGLDRQFNTSTAALKMVTFKDADEFGEVVFKSSDPVIINFHADWCQPCHVLTPKLTQVVGTAKHVKLCTINIEDFPEIAQEFEVQAIPAVVAVQAGRVVDKFIGLTDVNRIEAFVKGIDELKSTR